MPQSELISRPLERTSTPGVYRRGNRYVVRVKDSRGKQFQRSARTLAEARKVKAALAADIARGEFRGASRDTLEGYAATWAETYKGRTGRGIRRYTLEEYRRDLDLHVIPVLGHMRLVDIEPRDLKTLVGVLEGKGLAPGTIRNVIAPLRALLATAVEEGAIRANPAAGLRLPMPRRSPARKHLEPDELAALHSAVPEGWRLFVRLLAYSGARIGEFLELRWADVDLAAGTLAISRRRYRQDVDAPKSAYGVRTIPLTRDLVADLRRHRLAAPFSGDADPLFASDAGTPLHPSNVSRRVFKPAAAAAGVPWASFKTLRDTCGTLQAREGRHAEQIQPWLGHHSPSFTLDRYVGNPRDLPDPDALGLDFLADA